MEGYNHKENAGRVKKEVKGGERIRKIVESFTFKLVSALSFGFLSWAYYGHWSGWAGWIWVIPLVGFATCSARAIKAARRWLCKKQDTQQRDGLRQ